MYRYSIVCFSNFTNTTVIGIGLFTFDNGFLLMTNNSFVDANLRNSQLLNGGMFSPPSLTNSINRYVRNETIEMLTLGFNQDVYALFNLSYVLFKEDKFDNIVFFYLVAFNSFNQFKSSAVCNWFEDYDSP
jgi:hypothetical protein